MKPLLQSFTISGFRSLRSAEVELQALNVLVGANGSGKSNFILALRLVRAWAASQTAAFTAEHGGADALLCGGRSCSPSLTFALVADGFHGAVTASPTADAGLDFVASPASWPDDLCQRLAGIRIFHFKDLLPRRRLVLEAPQDDDHSLRNDAVNLGPYLRWLHQHQPAAYRRIIETTRLIAPFFDDFVFEPHGDNLRLRWREQGLDQAHGPEALSDGTVRFICLATLLLQPADRLPPLILLDEPELGLHPWAIEILAELIHAASAHTQVLLSTQSVSLLNAFELAHAIIVERAGEGTTLRRPDPEALAAWSEDASLGELWQRNLLGGSP